jgi:hypothetical protein
MRQVAKKGLLTAVATGGVLAVTGGMAYADSHASGVAAGSPGVLSGNTIQAPVNIPINACGNTVNVVGILNPAAGNICVNGPAGYDKGYGHDKDKGHGKKKESGGYRDKGYGGGDKGHGYGGGKGHGYGDDDYGYGHHGGASAHGAAIGSPGVLSGNVIQAPINIPINACGNSVNLGGLGNGTFGNACVNGGGHGYRHEGKGHHHKPEHHGNRHKPEHHGNRHKPSKGENEHGGGGGGGKGGNQPQSMAHPSARSLARTGAGDVATGLLTSAGLLLGGAVLFRRARAVRN